MKYVEKQMYHYQHESQLEINPLVQVVLFFQSDILGMHLKRMGRTMTEPSWEFL